MSWNISGNSVEFNFDKNGTAICGTGSHQVGPSDRRFIDAADLARIENWPASWEIRKKDEAELDREESRYKLIGASSWRDIAAKQINSLKNKNEICSIICTHGACEVFFTSYLPEHQFTDFYKLIGIASQWRAFQYHFNFECDGLIQPKEPIEGHEFLSFSEWVDGRPLISTNLNFRLWRPKD
jgi:hypothetical protein